MHSYIFRHFCAAALCLARLFIASLVPAIAAAQTTGTLLVDIPASGPRYAKGQTFWVYATPDRYSGTQELLGKGQLGQATQLRGEYVPGRYVFIIMGGGYGQISQGIISGGLRANRDECRVSASIQARGTTRVTLDPGQGCSIPVVSYGRLITGGLIGIDVQLSSASASLLRYQRYIDGAREWCERESAPYFAVYEAIRRTSSRGPFAVFPETQITRVGASGGEALGIVGLQLDAEAVRHFASYWTTRCWGDSGYEISFPLTPKEQQLFEVLNETVKSEKSKTRRLAGLADLLEAAEPRRPR